MFSRTRSRSPRSPSCEPLESRSLLAAGDLDPSFGGGDGIVNLDFPGTPFQVLDAALQPDGKAVVVGIRGTGFVGLGAVARLNADGSIDGTFGQGGLVEFSGLEMQRVDDVAIHDDGRIVVVGWRIDGIDQDSVVARLLPHGSLDHSFSGDGIRSFRAGDSSKASAVALQKDGKIIVAGGRFAGLLGDDDFSIVRFTSDGSFDDTFDFDGVQAIGFGDDEEAQAIAIDYNGTPQSNPHYGKIVVVGGDLFGASSFNVARLTPDGQPDLTFDDDGKTSAGFPGRSYAIATGVVIQPGGRIVATGRTGPGYDDPNDFAMARFLANGALDPSFGAQATGRVVIDSGGNDGSYDVAINDLGGLTVAGTSASGIVVAAYTADGRHDSRFAGGSIAVGTLNIHRDSAVGVAIGPGRQVVVAAGRARVLRLFDVAPVVRIASLDAEANEAGPNTAGFFVVRDERLNLPTRVHLDVGGSASPPGTRPQFLIDYTGFTPWDPIVGTGGYVDIPAGETFTTVIITPIDDAFNEIDETAIFTVRPDANNAFDVGTPASVTLTIRDNEAPPPIVTAARFAFESAPHRLRFTFSESVVATLGAADLVVQRLGAGGGLLTVFPPTYDGRNNTATFTFTSGTLLPDGNYRATLLAADVKNAAAIPLPADYVLDFSFRRGDANADGLINADDYFRIDQGFLAQPQNPTFVQGDFNYDGKINADDYFLIDQAFLGQSAPLATAAASISASPAGSAPSPATDDAATTVRKKRAPVARSSDLLTETSTRRRRHRA